MSQPSTLPTHNPATTPAPAQPGDLSWRLSSHPLTLLLFLSFRIAPLAAYLLGFILTQNFVLIFIITLLLLSTDFYYLKNIAGRRLVGLRWWNEVSYANASAQAPGAFPTDPEAMEAGTRNLKTESKWVFESAELLEQPDGQMRREQNATDRRFFWLGLYVQPVAWIALAVMALVQFKLIWLSLVVIALILGITNTIAFSRCDKFGQASQLAAGAMTQGGIARGIAGGVMGRFFG